MLLVLCTAGALRRTATLAAVHPAIAIGIAATVGVLAMVAATCLAMLSMVAMMLCVAALMLGMVLLAVALMLCRCGTLLVPLMGLSRLRDGRRS
jgi:hypothetical protein